MPATAVKFAVHQHPLGLLLLLLLLLLQEADLTSLLLAACPVRPAGDPPAAVAAAAAADQRLHLLLQRCCSGVDVGVVLRVGSQVELHQQPDPTPAAAAVQLVEAAGQTAVTLQTLSWLTGLAAAAAAAAAVHVAVPEMAAVLLLRRPLNVTGQLSGTPGLLHAAQRCC